FVFGLLWRRASALSVGSGIVAGELVAAYLISHPATPTWGINPGFFALFVNVAVCVAVAAFRPRKEKEPAVVTAGSS
ncbi:MAG: hypothetical protein ACXWNK_16085, partial [Vulcanimicrobiaceae bacterium]